MSPWSQFVKWGNCPRIFSARRRTLDLMQKLVPNDYCPSPEMIANGRAISLTIPEIKEFKSFVRFDFIALWKCTGPIFV